jgi:N-acetylglucosaminyldiphosphoundecaprenol N-acetyl-beta-D-mannosaminyltransferase
MLQDSPRFREVYAGAWLSLADGMSVVWAARLLGTPVPEKVSGSDLFPAVCEAAGPEVRIFLLGGRAGAADEAARVLRARNPGLRIVGTYSPPMGFERDAAELERANERVRAARPHVLFVGLGAPKQELYMAEQRDSLGVPVSIGVGVSFEFVAGMVERAPKWVQRAGLEWLDRIRREPRRLWKRYATTNPRFVALVLRQYARRG